MPGTKRKAEELIDLEKLDELPIEEQQEVAQSLLMSLGQTLAPRST